MAFAGISYLAVIAAAVASWLFGALWYGLLGNQWLDALGKTKDDLMPGGKMSYSPFVVSFVAQVVMAYVLAGLIGHLGPGHVTVRAGLISALFVWGGFVVTTLLTNHRFQGSRTALTLIDGGHWLGVLLVQGLVIGLLGV